MAGAVRVHAGHGGNGMGKQAMKHTVTLCVTAILIATLKYATPLIHDYYQARMMQDLLQLRSQMHMSSMLKVRE